MAIFHSLVFLAQLSRSSAPQALPPFLLELENSLPALDPTTLFIPLSGQFSAGSDSFPCLASSMCCFRLVKRPHPINRVSLFNVHLLPLTFRFLGVCRAILFHLERLGCTRILVAPLYTLILFISHVIS